MFQQAVVFQCEGCEEWLTPEECAPFLQRGVVFTKDLSEVKRVVSQGERLTCVALTNGQSDSACEEFLFFLYEHLAPLADLQVIVCDDPSVRLQCVAYEVGVRHFWGRHQLARRLALWLSDHGDRAQAAPPTLFSLGAAAARRCWQEIGSELVGLERMARSDFRLSHILGHFHSAQHNHNQAALAFSQAVGLNPHFIPANVALARCRLAQGNAEEALGLFQRLEQINGENPERKALMAAALADLGRWDEVVPLMQAASRKAPENPRVREMMARVLFHEGDVDKALATLRLCGTIDDYFLARLNEEAIRLSREQQTQRALQLYETAWNLAPSSLRYKLSFNIALAHKRSGARKLALHFAQRASTEAPMAAQDKIKQLVQSLLSEAMLK